MSNDKELPLASGGTQVTFIGGSLSNNKVGMQLLGEHDVRIFGTHIDNNESGIISEQSEHPEHSKGGPAHHWYQKPIGIVGITVIATLIAASAVVTIKHFFPSLGF
jgi:hypothetical protein